MDRVQIANLMGKNSLKLLFIARLRCYPVSVSLKFLEAKNETGRSIIIYPHLLNYIFTSHKKKIKML